MRKSHLIILALATLAAPAIAASPFDGTWKIDLASSQLDPKPDVFILAGGSFTCQTCAPPYTVVADGQPHAVTGRDYSDAIAVKVVDANTVTLTAFKAGKPVATRTSTVSPDGQTLTQSFQTTNAVTGATTTGAGSSTRVAAGPAGAHAISGSWRAQPLTTLSDTGTTISLKVVGNVVTLSDPGGIGYTAKAGGPAVLQTGDVAKTMINVAMPAPDTIVETDTRNGKVVGIFTMQLAPDGKSLAITDDDKKGGDVNHFTAYKQ